MELGIQWLKVRNNSYTHWTDFLIGKSDKIQVDKYNCDKYCEADTKGTEPQSSQGVPTLDRVMRKDLQVEKDFMGERILSRSNNKGKCLESGKIFKVDERRLQCGEYERLGCKTSLER